MASSPTINKQITPQGFIRPGYPDFSDLPWVCPLRTWSDITHRLVDLPKGLSRHTVLFVNYSDVIFAIKELPAGKAQVEFELLAEMEALRLPVVSPVGYRVVDTGEKKSSFLITRYLDHSLPYRSLFMSNSLMRYREYLLYAISGLMVQLHLAEVYWGDCSLSNTLFRRDAGALQAYLVDAETAVIYKEISAAQRYDDLVVMEENINGDLLDLTTANLLAEGVPISETGEFIHLRYQKLWEEITTEEVINSDERYRVHERIRALNALGFSVSEIELEKAVGGDQLRFRVIVSDRNFHHNQLLTLTGIDAQENQAQQMMNEIQSVKAALSQQHNRSTPLSAAAYYWLEHLYTPVIERFQAHSDGQPRKDLSELYCQVLEHKWFLSERARHDVGHQAAVDDYLRNVLLSGSVD
jgi:hypothetical protein